MMQSVQVIIERLKSNPEEFFGDIDEIKGLGLMRPKFSDVKDKLDNLLTENQDGQVHRLWYLEPEEKDALLAAYKEARRVRFEAKVFHTLLTKQEDKGVALQNRVHPRTGKTLMADSNTINSVIGNGNSFGWSDPRGMWGGAVPKAKGEPI